MCHECRLRDVISCVLVEWKAAAELTDWRSSQLSGEWKWHSRQAGPLKEEIINRCPSRLRTWPLDVPPAHTRLCGEKQLHCQICWWHSRDKLDLQFSSVHHTSDWLYSWCSASSLVERGPTWGGLNSLIVLSRWRLKSPKYYLKKTKTRMVVFAVPLPKVVNSTKITATCNLISVNLGVEVPSTLIE